MAGGVAKINVSAGELLDRISILEIKLERFEPSEKRERVGRELDALRTVCRQLLHIEGDVGALFEALKAVNTSLWDVEDKLRECERHKAFDQEFIELARSVYRLNDRRASLKNQISKLAGSELFEEKSYSSYS